MFFTGCLNSRMYSAAALQLEQIRLGFLVPFRVTFLQGTHPFRNESAVFPYFRISRLPTLRLLTFHNLSRWFLYILDFSRWGIYQFQLGIRRWRPPTWVCSCYRVNCGTHLLPPVSFGFPV